MSDTKLKPCPFCGAEVELHSVDIGSATDYFISCKECGCKQSGSISRQAVINAWNERKPMDNIVAELEEEKDYSYADMDEYGRRYELNLYDCDDFFYKGLARAIDIVKAGGVE